MEPSWKILSDSLQRQLLALRRSVGTVATGVSPHALTHQVGASDNVFLIQISDPASPPNDTFWLRRGPITDTVTVDLRVRVAGFTFTLATGTFNISQHLPPPITRPELRRYFDTQHAWRYGNRTAPPIHGPITDVRWQMPPQTPPSIPRYTAQSMGRYRANKSPLVFIPGPTVDTQMQLVPRAQPVQAQYALRTNFQRYVGRTTFVP